MMTHEIAAHLLETAEGTLVFTDWLQEQGFQHLASRLANPSHLEFWRNQFASPLKSGILGWPGMWAKLRICEEERKGVPSQFPNITPGLILASRDYVACFSKPEEGEENE